MFQILYRECTLATATSMPSLFPLNVPCQDATTPLTNLVRVMAGRISLALMLVPGIIKYLCTQPVGTKSLFLSQQKKYTFKVMPFGPHKAPHVWQPYFMLSNLHCKAVPQCRPQVCISQLNALYDIPCL